MLKIFKKFLRSVSWHKTAALSKSAELGLCVSDGEPTRRRLLINTTQRSMHVAVIGKSGSGKSSLLKYMAQQDIDADRGFVYFDLHGDATPFLLRSIAALERKLKRHLSDRLVVIAP